MVAPTQTWERVSRAFATARLLYTTTPLTPGAVRSAILEVVPELRDEPELVGLLTGPSVRTGRFRIRQFLKYYSALLDLLPRHPRQWPVQAWHTRGYLYSSHLKRSGRLNLTCFLLRNGVSPYVIAAYLESTGCLRDDSARRQVRDITVRWLQGEYASRDFDLVAGEDVVREAGVPQVACNKCRVP